MNTFLARNRLIILAYAGMVVLLLVTAMFSPGFLSASNMRSTIVLAAFVGIVALGQTFVIIGGGIDLSIPWVLNSAAIIMALLCGSHDAPLVWVVPLVLAGGATIGLINGAGVAYFGVPPIIMTLATNVILQGLILVMTGGSPAPSVPELVKFLAVGRIGPFPVIAFIWIVLTLIATLLLSKAAFGRHLYALGTSVTVAEFSGVPTARTTVITYMISGLTAALAGMLLTGYSGQAYLGMGDAYLFTSIAAVAIGGASILGGSGHYLGTVAGALVLTILTGLLPALNLSSGALLIVYGAVILLTVSIGSEIFTGIGGRLRRRRGKGEVSNG
jgi:ribose transport system permease protein